MTTETKTPDGFSKAWLTLREPADHAARAQGITRRLSVWAEQQSSLNCMELGAGTGSNLRFLCPLLGHDQRWLLVDNDPILLKQIPLSICTWAEQNSISSQHTHHEIVLKAKTFSARISWVQQDLAQHLAELPFRDNDLICASALLDLTSATWLEQLAFQCINHQCAALFVLNYNGQITWQKPIKEDQLMNELLNAHQLGDKGFGKALGPQAGDYLGHLLKTGGRQINTEQSNWVLDDSMRALQLALIEGWAPAATEQDPSLSAIINSWQQERNNRCRHGESALEVGHTDLLSLPN